MDSKSLARNLAQSLAMGPWSRQFIRATLVRRLPRQLHRMIAGLSEELIKSLPCAYAPSVKTVAGALGRSDRFEKILRHCIRHDVWPDPDLSSPAMAPVAAFATLDLPQLATLDALAEWLFLPPDRLEYLADKDSRYEEHRDAAVHHYHYIEKVKASGGVRIIEAPKPHLKAAQRRILRGILDKVPVHADAFGFVSGRNCLNGANRHVGEDVVVCFDLRNFFPSIGLARIFGLFRCIGYPHEVARLLTGLCVTTTPMHVANTLTTVDRQTYRRPHLPQGSPASPALANLAAFPLDRRLSGLAKSLDTNYSRYADDLSFSGDRESVGALLRAVPGIVADEGFELNQTKTRIMSATSRQMVTGIVVNDHLNIDRREFDRLKAIIHACGRPGDTRLADPVFRSALLGKIAWVEAVNSQRGQKLLTLLSLSITSQHA